MAEVQLALQRGPAGFEKLVVIKLVHEHLATQKDFVDMLLDEARVAALVKHPNVVDIYDLGEAAGRFYIAMEYLEGEPLLAVLRAGREGKRLDVLSTARLIADTAEGLDAAHELRTMAGDELELVHHDVSLGNIVILYNGQVKLVDFGVAKATQTVSSKTRVQGKFSYMAPEKLKGAAGDRRSDIWSLGCVMWESLTLKRLFKGGNDTDTMRQVLESQIPRPSAINGDVPRDFDAIVMKALARDPDERFATAKEMSVAIEEVLRLQSYGGKNDVIAKYMQATFDDHIVARKKLLQEVASKGRASADVLEAAFDDSQLASGTPRLSGEFSVRFRGGTLEHAAITTPEEASERLKTPSSSPVQPLVRRSGLIDAVAPVTAYVPELAPAATGTSAAGTPVKSRTSLLLGVLAIGVVAVIAYVVLSRGGSDEAAKVGAPPSPTKLVADAAPALVPAPDAAVAIDAPALADAPTAPAADPGSAAALGSGAGSGDDLALLDPDSVPDETTEEPTPPPTTGSKPAAKPSAAAAYKQGLQSYVRGDSKGALEAFKRAKSLNPSYAPTYRGLGLVYEKLGDRGAARTAYQRYLVLAPNAPDAERIRVRMGGL